MTKSPNFFKTLETESLSLFCLKMMKLQCPARLKSASHHPVFSNIARVFYYSNKTETPSSSQSPKRDTLYRRVSPVGDPRVSIVPILEQWVKEGKPVNQNQLRTMVKQFVKYKRFRHALDISQWMSDRRYILLSPGDIAVRMNLLFKIHGLEKVEEYFDNIPKQLKGSQTYAVLLSCYADEKSVEKVETLMQKMKELGFANTAQTYNTLLKFYSKMGQYEKLDSLMEEMVQKGIRQDMITLSIRLNAYAETGDIDGMQSLMRKMEADSSVQTDWTIHFIASRGCIKAGQIDLALEILKNAEGLITGKSSRRAYESLLTTYAGIGKKDELYRTWNLYKSSQKLYNSAYLCMIVSLLKLDDIEGAEKIFQEWETEHTNYDFRVTNILISHYCKNGLLEKAERTINSAIEKGKKPLANTWEFLATGLIKSDRIPEAVEAMKNAILAKPGRKPDRDTLALCLDFLKEKGDSERINEIMSLLGVPCPLETVSCDKLLTDIYGVKSECNTEDEIDGDVNEDIEDENQDSESRLESVS